MSRLKCDEHISYIQKMGVQFLKLKFSAKALNKSYYISSRKYASRRPLNHLETQEKTF